MKSKNVWVGIGLVVLVLSVVMFMRNTNEAGKETYIVDIYHSPTCGCCELYEKYLEENGFKVRSRETWDIEGIKKTLNIPQELWSCHTVKIGRYYIEGHVPLDAIQKLLEEQPNINGIALPGMPSGSPGMPGMKTEDFVIYAVSPEGVNEFMKI